MDEKRNARTGSGRRRICLLLCALLALLPAGTAVRANAIDGLIETFLYIHIYDAMQYDTTTPMANVTLTLHNADTNTEITTLQTDANGYAEVFDLAPGSYSITAHLGSSSQSSEPFMLESYIPYELSMNFNYSVTYAAISIYDATLATAQPSYLDVLSNSTIDFQLTDSPSYEITGGSWDGPFYVALPWGDYSMTVSCDGYVPASFLFTVDSTSFYESFYLMPCYDVPALVLDEVDEAPIAGATVMMGIGSATTDGEGMATVQDVPHGSVDVTVMADGYETWTETMDLTGTPELPLSYALARNHALFAATGSDGSPLEGVSVTFDGTTLDAPRTGTTDAEGIFSSERVPNGSYEWTATKAGYAAASGTFVYPYDGDAVSVVLSAEERKEVPTPTPEPTPVVTQEPLPQEGALNLILQAQNVSEENGVRVVRVSDREVDALVNRVRSQIEAQEQEQANRRGVLASARDTASVATLPLLVGADTVLPAETGAESAEETEPNRITALIDSGRGTLSGGTDFRLSRGNLEKLSDCGADAIGFTSVTGAVLLDSGTAAAAAAGTTEGAIFIGLDGQATEDWSGSAAGTGGTAGAGGSTGGTGGTAGASGSTGAGGSTGGSAGSSSPNARDPVRISMNGFLDGTRPGVNVALNVGDESISRLQGVYGAEIRIPYVPPEGENPNALVGEYIADDGTRQTIAESRYDAETGSLILSVEHFSKYGVAYRPSLYTDVPSSHWASANIVFLASRGVVKGDGNGRFQPEGKVLKTEFIEMMVRGVSAARLGTSVLRSYKDVKLDAWYARSVGWSYINNISTAIAHGDGRLGVGENITRGEMAVLINNMIVGLGIKPAVKNRNVRFSDESDMSATELAAIRTIASYGIISGLGNGRYGPDYTCTRAQAAVIVSHLLAAL